VKVSINRKLNSGRWPIVKVFPGLDRDAHFHRLFENDGLRETVL